MPRCIDCGREDTAEYLINGFCEDCIEFHDIPEWFCDETNFNSIKGEMNYRT